MTIPGAYTTVNGIASRPAYSYTPPSAFFDAGPPPPGTAVYNVLDYGAVASATVNNFQSIQNALDDAHAAGGGMVYVPTGTYGVAGNPNGTGGLYLHDNVFLKGDGMGQTTLRVVDGWDGKLTGIVRTPREETNNYGIADVTLDGNRQNTTGKVDGYYSGGIPDDTITDHDAYLIRVETQNNAGYGFDPHERTERLLIAESVSHHNGLDGFVADYIIDGEYRDNLAYENDRHGFNLTTTTNDFLLIDNVALNNGSAGVIVQRGGFDIPLPNNIVIMGGELSGNAGEGIHIRLSENVLITGVYVHDNGTYGVRVRGSDHVTVTGNVIEDNSQREHDKYSAVQVSHEDDGIAGQVFHGDFNVIEGNLISTSGAVGTRYGIEEKDEFSNNNVFLNNVIENQVRGLAKLFGEDSVFMHFGGAGDDVISGTSITDVLNGNDGSDRLSGKDGTDFLQGGPGGDQLDGGAGIDRATYSGSDAGVTINLATGATSGGDAAGDSYQDIEGINGSAHDDVLTGDDADNVLVGLAGNDQLFGGGGDDILRGGEGTDLHDGGEGDDRADYIASSAPVQVDLLTGTVAGGDAAGDTFAGIEQLAGSIFDDQLIGDNNDNVLIGRAGDDVLSGNAGDDTLRGGSGADQIDGGAGVDRVSFGDSDAGVVVDLAAMSVAGGYGNGDTIANVEGITGSHHNDVLNGDDGANTLAGKSGNDQLDGRGGDDVIKGGAGKDVLKGGAGADTFVIEIGDGVDTIVDFDVAEDVLDLTEFGLGAAAMAAASQVVGNQLRIDLGNGDVLSLDNLTIAELQPAVIL